MTGGRWRNRVRAWLGRVRKPPRPVLFEQPGALELRFAHGVGQSRMDLAAPDYLLIDYTRTMLGALALHPRPRSIGVVGLGGGSQVKFCHRHLPAARLEVMEVNPGVVALRERFHIPPDDARLQVHLADAAQFLPRRRSAYGVLLVDGYDESGIPAALATTAFHKACRDALRDDGVLATNVYAADVQAHVARMRNAFGRRIAILEEPAQGNVVVLAWNAGVDLSALAANVGAVLHGLDAQAGAQLAAALERVAAVVTETAGAG